MSFVLTCPNCGPREVTDFGFGGEVDRRPREAPSPRELSAYNYFRGNVAGVQREWWFHRSGCRAWFLAERDTRTNEVLDGLTGRCRPMTPARRAAARASASTAATATVTFTFDGKPVTRLRGRHDRLGPVRRPASAPSRAASSTTGRAG